MKILLTGKPGVGKSTILQHLQLKYPNIKGCIVKEVLENNKRTAFNVVYLQSLDEHLLASKDKQVSDKKIGSYFVDIDHIKNIMIPFIIEKLLKADDDAIIMFDEIGRMQNLESSFLMSINSLLQSRKTILATIVYDDEAWARAFKNNKDSFFMTVTKENREYIPTLLSNMLNCASVFKNLNQQIQFNFIKMYNRFFNEEKFEELNKLFCHTVYYLNKKRINFDSSKNEFTVYGFHHNRIIKPSGLEKYSCSCDFYNKDERECSHIQTVKLTSQS